MPLGPGSSTLTPTMIAPPRMSARVSTVRRQFNLRAPKFAASAWLVREVEQRIFERLSYIRLAPDRILDVGCGSGAAQAAFAKLYPRAHWIGVDVSERMLRESISTSSPKSLASRLRSGLRGSPACAVADAGQLPIASDSIDLLFSNLMLHWHPEPHLVFPEWKRVMKVDGVLMFSCFGPDTLKELRAAALQALPDARPMPFIDMHDFGDMMVAAGFSTPVMDSETLTLTYGSAQDLLREVRALGGNPRDDRKPALPSGRQAHRLLELLESSRADDGRIRLTFEIAYGHAWKPQPKSDAATISVDAVRAQLAGRNRRR